MPMIVMGMFLAHPTRNLIRTPAQTQMGGDIPIDIFVLEGMLAVDYPLLSVKKVLLCVYSNILIPQAVALQLTTDGFFPQFFCEHEN